MSLVERQIRAIKWDMREFISVGVSFDKFMQLGLLSCKNFTLDELKQLWRECLEEEE